MSKKSRSQKERESPDGLPKETGQRPGETDRAPGLCAPGSQRPARKDRKPGLFTPGSPYFLPKCTCCLASTPVAQGTRICHQRPWRAVNGSTGGGCAVGCRMARAAQPVPVPSSISICHNGHGQATQGRTTCGVAGNSRSKKPQ
jgi:hypothetical protein